MEAGKHAELAVTVLDQFGNVTTDLAGHSVEAVAHGPAIVPFAETAAGVYRSARKLLTQSSGLTERAVIGVILDSRFLSMGSVHRNPPHIPSSSSRVLSIIPALQACREHYHT